MNANLDKLARLRDTIRDNRQEIPKVTFNCYVCGQTAVTYQGCQTIPPDPDSITQLWQIQRVSTCSNSYCLEVEQRRQDAIVQALIAPIRDAYHRRRAEENERDKR